MLNTSENSSGAPDFKGPAANSGTGTASKALPMPADARKPIFQSDFYFGSDAERVYWILRNYDDKEVKLTESSIIKEWELLQIVASFLLAGGVATNSFSTSIACPSGHSGRFVPPGLFPLLCGSMLLLLFAVLLSTALCRMFVYGQHTMLLMYSNNIVCKVRMHSAGVSEEDIRDEYRRAADAGMVQLARVTGVMSIVSKIFVLLVIALWMVAILVVAAQCAAQLVFIGLLTLTLALFVAFFGCLTFWFLTAGRIARHKDFVLANQIGGGKA